MNKLLDFYHGMPPKVRGALFFAIGAAYQFGDEAYTKHLADVAAHQASSFDIHSLVIHMFVTGLGTFVAHLIPYKSMLQQCTTDAVNSPKEGTK